MRDENEESEAVACPQQLHPCGIQNIPGTHCIKYSHPGLGGAGPDIDVAEDVHSSQQAVEKPPAARLGHNICLLGPQPEGHEQPVDPCREKRLKFSKLFPGEAANSPSSRSITGLTLGWSVGGQDLRSYLPQRKPRRNRAWQRAPGPGRGSPTSLSSRAAGTGGQQLEGSGVQASAGR